MEHHDWAGIPIPNKFDDPPISLEVRGELACFTRPEFQAERVSYPLMTPSAAVGLVTAVFWKPEIRYVVDSIDVLQRGGWLSMRRNEAAIPITRDALRRGWLSMDDSVQQRMTTMLRDVAYRIHVNVWVHPGAREQHPAKWRDQLRRRIQRGQSFRTPFLGMREFHADVSPPTDQTPDRSWSEDLGPMVHSIQYDDRTGKESYSFFQAAISLGTMSVPRIGFGPGAEKE